MDTLVRIKRLLVRRQYRFSLKALEELQRDSLSPEDAIESVLNATEIKKVLRSSGWPERTKERLYVIESTTYSGTLIYSKGKIAQEGGEPVYYFFISAKPSRYAD